MRGRHPKFRMRMDAKFSGKDAGRRMTSTTMSLRMKEGGKGPKIVPKTLLHGELLPFQLPNRIINRAKGKDRGTKKAPRGGIQPQFKPEKTEPLTKEEIRMLKTGKRMRKSNETGL